MRRIGIMSDTHGYLDDAVFEHFKNCDEVWHAGDFGNLSNVNQLSFGDFFVEKFENLFQRKIIFRGVFGNIDDVVCRNIYSEKLFFTIENVNVFIQHIGGYPNRYSKGVKEDIVRNKSKLFVSGHSHILKIMYDEKLQCLHMNPGAAGKQGWQKVRTLIRFIIDGDAMKNCEVVELGLFF